MALFKTRTKPKNKILIALDVAIQDCQKKLNEADEEFMREVRRERSQTGGTSQGAISRSNKSKIDALDQLKRQLLANITQMESEIETIKKYMRDIQHN